jgi:hypothetical protein
VTSIARIPEFPDYPVAALPAIPLHWRDISSRKDACPSFSCGEFVVYVDFPTPGDREEASAPRFRLQRSHEAQISQSDDWHEVLFALVGSAFADLFERQVTADALAIVRQRNRDWNSPLVCATHDFLDANMVMAAAFDQVMGHEPKGSWETHYDSTLGRHVADDPEEEQKAERDTALINAAWDFAKKQRLTALD